MIKMVCSDLDGTLLQYGKKLIEGEIFDEIRALHDRGILFCPASGRQYTSLRKLFAPVADDCIYLCENGAVVYRGGKVIAKTPMPRALAEEIAWDFWNNTEDLGEVMLSGENMSYLMERGHGVVDRIKFIGNNIRSSQTPPRSRRISSRCPSIWWTAWSRLWSALCPNGSRPTAPWRDPSGSIPPWPTRGLAYRASAVCWALTRRM